MSTASTYTHDQIVEGLKLAAQWYEGWKVDDLAGDQLLECIEKARQGAEGEHPNQVR